jgi:putative tryptophan/tyrosine transport system substrate-binding protein
VVAFLGAGSASTYASWLAAFVKRLGERGWIDRNTVSVEYRWANGRNERITELAAELARLKVNVIVTDGNAATSAAEGATSSIPIVFAVAGDPVGTGLVASLARPGSNATGMSLQMTDTAGKRIELLREVIPDLRTLAIMANVGNSVSVLEMKSVEAAARTIGLKARAVEIRLAEDIAPAFENLKGVADALYVGGDPLLFDNRVSINTLAIGAKLPTIGETREIAEAGGLMTYGPNFPDLFRRAAELVDKILRGAKSADIPVEQATKFDLVINLKTAKALGLTVQPVLLATADEVIE